jgi:hypothetical protein
LEEALGGPGYENLLILSPSQTLFYGGGWGIDRLRSLYPGGWWGCELPHRGYWRIDQMLDEDEIVQKLEQAVRTKPASQIEVKSFKHIVICPLLLRGRPQKVRLSAYDSNNMLDPWVKEFTENNLWREATSQGVHDRFSYNEMVYFHPHVRDFLFGDGDPNPSNRSTRILTRDDLQMVDVELGNWQPKGVRLRFDVSRTELYLCKPGVVILVVEVTNPHHLDSEKKEKDQQVMLSELQDFTDQFRRLYPPFWWDEEKEGLDAAQPGLCLRALSWLGADGKPLVIADHLHTEDTANGEPLRGLN